jgi:predicted PurR-regulated permease PerM
VSETTRTRLGARTLFVGAALIIVLAGLKAAQTLVIPFLLALFLAIICAPVVSWLTGRKVPVGLAVLAVVIVLLAVFSGFGAIVGGSVNEFAAFAAQNQARFDGLVESASSWFEARDIDPETLDILNMLQPGRLINLLGGVLKNLAAVLSNLFMIMLTMIFMLFEAASVPTKVRAAIGTGRFDVENMRHAVIQVQRYLGLKTLTSLTTGLLIGLWTAILGLDFAVVWGLLAFLLNYIPNIGSIVAAIPAVLLGLVQGGIGFSASAISPSRG